MTNPFMTKALSLTTPIHLIGAAAAVTWTKFAMQILDKSYAASNHPADVFTGQTSFNATQIKDYYAFMAERGTFDIYFQTQLIDFGFIIGVFMTGLMLSTLAMRAAPPASWGYTTAKWAGLSAMAAACADALENFISFAMLANPTGFADWIALPYSAVASFKFAGMTAGMALLALALIMIALGKLFGQRTAHA